MIEAVSGFLEALRAHGVRVSPAEAVDAVRALEAAGVEAREAARLGLKLTCVKARPEREWFEAAFASYFAAPPRRVGRDGEGASGSGAGSGPAGDEPAGRDGRPPTLPPRGARTGGAPPGGVLPPVPPPTDRRTAPRPPGSPLARRLAEQARRRESRLRTLVLERAARVPGRGSEPRPPRATPTPGAGAVLEARRRTGPAVAPAPRSSERAGDGSAGEELRRRDLRAPASAEIDARLLAEAARIVAEMRVRRSRRLEPGRRGRLALKRTLRSSLATAGVPFRLRHARRRPRRPRVVLLLDVSFSVARASGLFLRLSATLLEAVARTRVLAFVDRPVDATRALLAWAREGGMSRPGAPRSSPAGRAPSSFAAALGSVAGLDLGGRSDYGRAFFALLSDPTLKVRPDVLLVLGDGRTNRFDRLGWAFAELCGRARRVVWIVPERAATWGTSDSALGEYLPHADLAVEGADLAGLVEGLRRLLRVAGA